MDIDPEMEDEVDGGAIDLHKWIGKLPRPKDGWTEKGLFGNKIFGKKTMRYHGPYNNLDKQLVFDPENGKIKYFIEKPAGYIEYPKVNGYIDDTKPNSLDFWAAVHDVKYSMAALAKEKALQDGYKVSEANKIAHAYKNKADVEMAKNIKMSGLVKFKNPMASLTHYGMRLKNTLGFGIKSQKDIDKLLAHFLYKRKKRAAKIKTIRNIEKKMCSKYCCLL